jgi:flagellin
MRSDNKALSTVQDALGLGAATVDVAYTAMDSVKDVLDQIKTKLVSASQPGVDKSKIQSDITELQNQLKTYASSASFSGNNWLSVDSSSSSYKATQSVVSSFNRSPDNQVSISTIDIDISSISLFDANTTAGKDGILEGGTSGQGTSAAFAYAAGDMDDGGSLTLAISVDGATAQNVAVNVADAANFTLDDLVAGINGSLTGATASKSSDGKLVLTSDSTGTTSSVELTGITAKKADASTSTASVGFTTIAEADGAATGGGIMDIDITSATDAQMKSYTDMVERMSGKVTTAAANLGSVKSRIDMQQDFVKNLMDAVDRGVGALVDADMSQESTRLQALQTQQQLGIQALSIANSNSQSILSLFR